MAKASREPCSYLSPVTTSVNVCRIGDLVSKIGSAAFGSEYFRLFNDALSIEHCTVFAFKDGGCPVALVAECASQDTLVRTLAHEYVAGAFRYDPNIRHEVGPSLPLIFALRAADISDAAYRQHFYDEASLSHELVLLAKVNGTLFYSSFYRSAAEREFNRDDINTVQLLSYLAIRALQRQVELQDEALDFYPSTFERSEPFGRRRDAFLHVRKVFLSDSARLSPREADISAAIVMGYSTVAISLNLGITLNTVATHRKRSYSKLGISSQTELCGMYFRNMAKISPRGVPRMELGAAPLRGAAGL